VALLDLDEEVGAAERHVRQLRTLGAALDASVGRHVPVNVTGAVAALLLGIGIPVAAVRGISVAARAGGLVGHVVEESRTHLARAFWDDVRSGVEYVEPGHDGGSG
jgi:citrate synthase